MKNCYLIFHKWTEIEFYDEEENYFQGLNITEPKIRKIGKWRKMCMKCGKVKIGYQSYNCCD